MAVGTDNMKLRCRVLGDLFNDAELKLFLDMTENNEEAAIYEALESAYTVAEQARSRGGVSEIYAVDWEKLIARWKQKAADSGYENAIGGVFVVKRE